MSLKIHAIRQSEAEKAKDRNWSRGRIQHVREYDNNQNKVTQKFEQRLKNIERSLHAANDVMTGYPQPHPVPHPSFMPANVYPHQPTSAYSWQTPTRQPKHQKNRHCYVCNSGRHFSNQCPHREETTAKEVYGDAQENAEMDEPNIVKKSLVKGPTSAYIKAQIRGKTVSCLLDSGSESSILSDKFIRERDLRSSQRTLLAVNNSEVCVLGEAKVKMNVGGMCVSLPALVSTEVDGVVLGLDWMKRNRLSWRFQDSFVRLAGRRIPLHFRLEPARCRRMAVARDVDVPPLSEQHVEAYAILPDLAPNDSSWATRPTVLNTGLVVAGAVLPKRTTGLTMRVLNPTDRAIRLKKGIRCDLEEVVVLERPAENLQTGDCFATRQVETSEVESTIEPLWRNVADDVPAEIRQKLKNILLEHRAAFSLSEWDLGYTDILQHKIDTGNESPVRQPLRRQPLVLLPLIDEQVELMLSQGLIEKSYGDWASNVVIVTKKDGSPRFCIDYRAVNNKTRKDAFPLPLISECLDTLGGSSWFSTFDLRSGYHQVALHPDDRHKTAFVTRGGYYQFKVLPFGLTGSPSCFSRLMTLIMSGLNFTTCLIYLDDIIIFSSDLDTHLERLILVLKRLTAANLKLKPSKCHLLQRKVLFLGHVVSGSGVATDPAKVDAVKNWPIPTKLKEVRAFMGLCSYYRKFVPDFARIGRPLHAMTKKDTRFIWTEECNEAFLSLKTHLTEAPILALPNDIGSFILHTDASGESIGGVLS